MLPSVISESAVQPFKFWFNGTLQDGLHFHNELYYRLKEQPITARSKLYHLACKLSRRGADILLTVDKQQCSLWANLRNQRVAALTFSARLPLPSAEALLVETVVSYDSSEKLASPLGNF
ncbi:MAG: hypothetical protein F6J95_005455 [Leptolyngbya sp. SIO1E4]|nr:hypothetical protein [Leptolyngbya sp. SIO1E4]